MQLSTRRIDTAIRRFWNGEEDIWKAALLWVGVGNGLFFYVYFNIKLGEPKIMVIAIPLSIYYIWSILGLYKNIMRFRLTRYGKYAQLVTILFIIATMPYWFLIGFYSIALQIIAVIQLVGG